MKTTIIVLVIIILAGLGFYFINGRDTPTTPVTQNTNTTGTTDSTTPTTTTTTNTNTLGYGETFVLGTSVDGRDITAYSFGSGNNEVMFIGGIHGGYAWNTALLGFNIVDYLKDNPNAVPEGVKVPVVPVFNPDGLNKTTGTEGRFTVADVPDSAIEQAAGRFNANEVDLNRNFDCDWQANAKWQNKTVSGGDVAFSEPETLALKNYVDSNKPAAVVAYYSAAGGVFASNCHGGVLPETQTLTKTYSDASAYKAYQDFDFYETTGDMTNWLAKINIPAISVLLTNHTSTEWTKNKAGIDAILKLYANK
jgi:hypothetical protein